MKLYIGGRAQGKTEYVKSLFPEADVCDETDFHEMLNDDNTNVGKVIWNHFHLCLKSMMEGDMDADSITDYVKHITETRPDIIIVSDEVGNGIVPIDAAARDYRELVGRLLIKIAEQSESVERIICQIPMKLK